MHTSSGCDSIVVTVLAINPKYNFTSNAAFCQGDNYTLPGGQSVTAPGVYTSSLHTVAGCDSIFVTTLTMRPTYSFTNAVSICSGESYLLPGGQTVSTAGTYRDTLQTFRGCDSVITTNLTVKPVYSYTRTGYYCHGSGYTLPGGFVVHVDHEEVYKNYPGILKHYQYWK